MTCSITSLPSRITPDHSTRRLSAALSDRYSLERELGAGGMATVYLAEDLKHQRKVAIKVLRRERSETLGSERFAREIAVAARLPRRRKTSPHRPVVLRAAAWAGCIR